MKRYAIAVAAASLLPAYYADAKNDVHVYSNYEAAERAKFTLRLLDRLWDEGSEVCRFGEHDEKVRISMEAVQAKKSLDIRPEGHRAFAPYWACSWAAHELASRMWTCAKAYSTASEIHSEDEWKRDRTNCAAAIAKPDLSLIRQK